MLKSKVSIDTDSHSATIPFSDAIISRSSDGVVNLPLTITYDGAGTEKWYAGAQLIKSFYSIPVADTTENESLKFGSSDSSADLFQGELDMAGLWSKEFTAEEVSELVSEYDPQTHSRYATHAVGIWPLGEDLITGNTDGSAVYDITENLLHGTPSGLSSADFVAVDLTAYNALSQATYSSITVTVLNATTGAAINGATVELVGIPLTLTPLRQTLQVTTVFLILL